MTRSKKRVTISADAYKSVMDNYHDLLVVMQSAFIEWKHGKGAEAGMGWIGNTLWGPGLIPADDAPYSKEAQAWYDANQANPMPKCECGKPSNIGWMGKGFCSQDHYNKAKALSLQ